MGARQLDLHHGRSGNREVGILDLELVPIGVGQRLVQVLVGPQPFGHRGGRRVVVDQGDVEEQELVGGESPQRGRGVDDLVVVGAEPLFMTDYIATGKVVPEKIAAIVRGIAEGCLLAGCALVGGKTGRTSGRHGCR